MKSFIDEFIDKLKTLPEGSYTVKDFTKMFPKYTQKQVANTINRARANGYLENLVPSGRPGKYRIIKNPVKVKVETLKSVKVHSVKSHTNNGFIDVVVTLK